MELNNTFTVNLSIEETWTVLMDLERVARCIPGAAILDVDGEVYHGAVKIKVGPVTTQYKGTAEFVEKDEQAHRTVIKAVGSDTGGQGNADAKITISLSAEGSQTKVNMLTDLALSGRVAQFGRGVVADVANKILKQFVKNLEADLTSGAGTTSSFAASTSGDKPAGEDSGAARPSIDDVEPLDALGSFGDVIAKYALPAVGAVAAIVGIAVLARLSGQGHSVSTSQDLPIGHRGMPAPIFSVLPIIIHTGSSGESVSLGRVNGIIEGEVAE